MKNTITAKIRRFFFGLNTEDKIELCKLIRESENEVKERYRKRIEIMSMPIPNCDGTFPNK